MINSISFFNIIPAFIHKGVKNPVKEAQQEDLFELLIGNFSLDLINSKQEEIKAYFHSHPDVNKLNLFLQQILEKGIEHHCSEQVFAILAQALTLERLSQLAKNKAHEEDVFFDSITNLAQMGAEIHPRPIDSSMVGKIGLSLRGYRPLFLYFIPNVINNFFRALNFLDSQKHTTNLWEKYLLAEIVFKILQIPLMLTRVLEPILVVPAKVYGAAALIIAGVGALIAVYQRWLRPFPDEIVNCENLNKKMQGGLIEPTIHRKEVDELVSALEGGSNVLLVGKSGDGKTSLVHRYLQLKQEGKLPKPVQDLRDFEMDCGALLGNGTFGFANVLDQVKESIPSSQMRKALIFFDKVEQIASDEPSFQAFSKRFFEDQPSPVAIAATTYEGLKKIRAMDKDGSFLRRFQYYIELKPASDGQNLAMLRAYMNRKASDLLITEGALNQIIECAGDKEYRPLIGTASKVISIADNLIGRCRAAPNKLVEAEEAFASFKSKMINAFPLNIQNATTYQDLHRRKEKAKQKWEQQKVQVRHIQKIAQQRNHYFKLTHQIAEANSPNINPNAQKLYLLYHFYGLKIFEKMIEAQLVHVNHEMNGQINKNLVEAVFQQLKNLST